jgi:PAS domain-containing protein
MSFPVNRPRLITIPSTDTAFRTHVDRLRANEHPASAGDLEARLRRLFPRVVVVERSLSGEMPAWYVYRDGRWVPSAEAAWWTEPAAPRLEVSLDGWIIAADTAARALLNLTAAEVGTRYFTDFIAPGTLEDAEGLRAIVQDGHTLSATVLVRPAGGEVLGCDIHAERDGDRVVAHIRLAEDVDVDVPSVVVPRPISLACHPLSDVAFSRYAEVILGQMPEPTPDGLALRLRRLYRHARVDPLDDRWMVFRDARAVGEAPDGWWLDPDLPRVRYDGQALIVEANEAAERLLGQHLVGHHWQEFVTAGSTGRVGEMVSIIMEAGVAVSRFQMPGADGSVEFDSFTEFDGATLTTIMRPTVTDLT